MNEALEGIIHKQNEMKDILANLECFEQRHAAPRAFNSAASYVQLIKHIPSRVRITRTKERQLETMEPEALTGKIAVIIPNRNKRSTDL